MGCYKNWLLSLLKNKNCDKKKDKNKWERIKHNTIEGAYL